MYKTFHYNFRFAGKRNQNCLKVADSKYGPGRKILQNT